MRGKLYSLNVFIYFYRSRLHYSTIVISVNFLFKKRTFILMGSSEELSVSVYLTMVFSNKMMKGLLIVLSEALRRQQAY